jgi:hypothetical protein
MNTNTCLSPMTPTYHCRIYPPVKIPLLDDKPGRIKPLMDAELNRQVSKPCQAGVMEPTISPYWSPIFLVRKPNPPETPANTGNGNSFRAVTDYILLNLKISPVYHALPRVEDCMHKIGRYSQYLTIRERSIVCHSRRKQKPHSCQYLQIPYTLYPHAFRN